jgi:hypothetical protein
MWKYVVAVLREIGVRRIVESSLKRFPKPYIQR